MNIKAITLFALLLTTQMVFAEKIVHLSSCGLSKDEFIEKFNSIESDVTDLRVIITFLAFNDSKFPVFCSALKKLQQLEVLDLNNAGLVNLNNDNIADLVKTIREIPSLKTVKTLGSTFHSGHKIQSFKAHNKELLKMAKQLSEKLTEAGFAPGKNETWTRTKTN
jgi:hypothetical protein